MKREKIWTSCPQCGASFIIPPYLQYVERCCSRSCAATRRNIKRWNAKTGGTEPGIPWRRTRYGLLVSIYSGQRACAKTRNMPPPSYTKQWLIDQYLDEPKFVRLYSEWAASGYRKLKRPSVDRINCKRSYTPANIHLMTWAENRYKQRMERRSRKGAVVQLFKGVVVATFLSQTLAAKKTGIDNSSIADVISGKRVSAGGFQWAQSAEEGLKKPTTPPLRNTCGYRGVAKKRERYTASFQDKGRREFLGGFDTPAAAAKAYDLKARAALGDRAILNFPC